MKSIFHPSNHNDKHRYTKLASVLMLAVCLSACKKTPDWVIDRESMANLMADIHTGEATIDFNYSRFPNDSTRKMLKQSIYAAHGVTAEQVDTSYVWYGNHIEEYIKVYDRTIEILKERQLNFASATSAQIAISGDSVAVWQGPQRVIVAEDMPARAITFSLVPDSTWQKGDIYTLRYKPINATGDIETRLLVDYADGTIGYVDEPVSSRLPHQMHIQVDSTLAPLRIYGYLAFSPSKNVEFEIDSITLTRQRKHLVSSFYNRPKIFRSSAINDDSADTTSVASTIETPEESKNRRPVSTDRQQPAAREVQLPNVTWENKKSEHRQDALQHKPSAKPRREARERQRKNQPAKKATTTAPSKIKPTKNMRQP